MLSRSPAAASLPNLGDLDYWVQGLLPTDSKMSEILLATDRHGQTVVFKIACVQQRVRAETNRRAIHNSVLWLQTMRDHPGIAQLQPIRRKDAGGAPPTFIATLPDWPGAPDFLITEYLGGGTLSSFVGKRPLSVDLALTLTYALAQTLAYLHAHGCAHRDLKPENILFRTPPTPSAPPSDLQPVLIDFGIAARIGEAKLVSGSRLWMAPELQEAYEKQPLPVDPSWDLYALGLICCYMLSGIRPRRRQYSYQDCIDYRNEVFAFLHGEAAQADVAWQQFVATLQQLLTRILAREPENRPTAAAFAAELATLLLRMDITPPTHPVQPTSPDAVQQPLPGLSAVTGALANLTALGQFGGSVAHSIQPLAMPHVSPVGRSLLRGIGQQGRWLGVALLGLLSLAFLLPMLNQGATDTNVATSVATTIVVAPSATIELRTAVALPPTTNDQTFINSTAAQPTTVVSAALPPTLAALPTAASLPIPTLALINPTQLAPPPTLVQFTPTSPPTATQSPIQPTATATATPLPPTPTRLLPTATRQSPTVALLAAIRLRQPPANLTAAQDRVEFAWEAVGGTLTADHCYELVFWDSAKAHDKRSPIGAGLTTSGTVNFSKLRESPDPLLRSLARSPQGFDWGVRFVSCVSPKTVLQDVIEVRHYTYQP